MTERTVKVGYRWSNNMVMVFDHDGEQIPELQGPYTEALAAAVEARSLPGRTQLFGWPPEQPLEWRHCR